MPTLKNPLLHRYWIEFSGEEPALTARYGLGLGCGVTAYSVEDALSVVRTCIFQEGPMPAAHQVTEDVDVRHLDAGHVLPNMSEPVARGVWFPAGYLGRRR